MYPRYSSFSYFIKVARNCVCGVGLAVFMSNNKNSFESRQKMGRSEIRYVLF